MIREAHPYGAVLTDVQNALRIIPHTDVNGTRCVLCEHWQDLG
ncbi:hypothetical protein LTSEINV_3627 [Salmonella enterica subsp. enterica serovar Inverness str. R8-3668]|uniref:Uncharacterized protein n=1 Tax=Salmonella enterica subsp. enterica serovar Inverness str. R8-3668 TaxID=913075 RepID=G5NFQ4_SALET|nr:hypothetical protein LTSEINV_3627 [Salmonella enterica subsp. enterica serovar Inverness str. R8-3668]